MAIDPAAMPVDRTTDRSVRCCATPRILRPFLIYGFVLATCQTAQGQTLGFLIIDKLHLPPMQAQGYTAVAMMAGAVTGLLAQWGLIRIFPHERRSDLLRWGAGIAALANLIVAFSPSYSAGGDRLCPVEPGLRPGAAGLHRGSVTRWLSQAEEDQARTAGAIAAVNGLNVVVAPLFVLLYGRWGPAPFLLNAVLLAGLLAFAWFSPRLIRAGDEATTDEEASDASLERDREGVSV